MFIFLNLLFIRTHTVFLRMEAIRPPPFQHPNFLLRPIASCTVGMQKAYVWPEECLFVFCLFTMLVLWEMHRGGGARGVAGSDFAPHFFTIS